MGLRGGLTAGRDRARRELLEKDLKTLEEKGSALYVWGLKCGDEVGNPRASGRRKR